MATKKYKKLTNKEKAINKQVRDELREKGILPERKKPVNRKKYAKEIVERTKDSLHTYEMHQLIGEVVLTLMPHINTIEKYPTLKVGDLGYHVVQIVEMADNLKRFRKELKDRNISEYTLRELYNKVYVPVIGGRTI